MYNYDLNGEQIAEEISPLKEISENDYEEDLLGNASSPLSELMKTRAKELSPRRQDVISRRDALLEAYKKLILSQQNKPLSVNNLGQWMAGSAGLMESQDPNMRAFGAGQIARAKAMMSENEKENESLKNQALAQLKMESDNLGFLDKDQEIEMDLLKGAASNDYQQQMLQMKMLLAAMRNSTNNSTINVVPPETFTSLGVPQYSGPDPYAGIDDVGKRQMRMNYEKQITKDQDKVSDSQAAIDRMKRFQELNELAKDNVIGTGPIAKYVPTFSEQLKEMQAISSEITPQMRVPGSGASSDFDAKMFKEATVGLDKDYEVNKNISTAYIAAKENEINKPDFLEAYLSANGHLRGSQQAWKKYLNDNPIFDPKSKEFNLNQSRKTWQEYFGGTRENLVEKTTEEGLPPPPAGYDSERWKKVYNKMTPEQRKLFEKKDASGIK